MSNEITQSEYWKEIAESAKSILEEVGVTTAQDIDEKEDEIHERTWETADGHQWVIYNWYNQFVIRHSPNEGYYEENFGIEGYAGKSYSEIGNLVAFGAFYADLTDEVNDRLQSILDEAA